MERLQRSVVEIPVSPQGGIADRKMRIALGCHVSMGTSLVWSMHPLATVLFDAPEEIVDASLHFVTTQRFVQERLKHAGPVRARKDHYGDCRTIAG